MRHPPDPVGTDLLRVVRADLDVDEAEEGEAAQGHRVGHVSGGAAAPQEPVRIDVDGEPLLREPIARSDGVGGFEGIGYSLMLRRSHRQRPTRLPGGGLNGDLRLDHTPYRDHSEDEDEQHRYGDGRLHQRLPAFAATPAGDPVPPPSTAPC